MRTRQELKHDQTRFAVWIVIAAAAHVAVVVLSFLFQLYYLRTHPPVKIIAVSLVTLPGAPGSSGGPAASVPDPSPESSPEPASVAPAPKTVTKAPEPKAPEPKLTQPKVPEKIPEPLSPRKPVVPAIPEKPNRQQSLNSALEKIGKTMLPKKPAANSSGGNVTNINSAVSRPSQNVEVNGAHDPASSGSGSGGAGGFIGSGGQQSDPYLKKIIDIIQHNWDQTFKREYLRTTENMEVKVSFNISPNGSISFPKYIERSSSAYMNSTVGQVLQISSPFEKPPKAYGELKFLFTPKGLKNDK